MVTIHSIEEMLNFYISLGGLRKDAANGFRYVFPRQHSKVRFWGRSARLFRSGRGLYLSEGYNHPQSV